METKRKTGLSRSFVEGVFLAMRAVADERSTMASARIGLAHLWGKIPEDSRREMAKEMGKYLERLRTITEAMHQEFQVLSSRYH